MDEPREGARCLSEILSVESPPLSSIALRCLCLWSISVSYRRILWLCCTASSPSLSERGFAALVQRATREVRSRVRRLVDSTALCHVPLVSAWLSDNSIDSFSLPLCDSLSLSLPLWLSLAVVSVAREPLTLADLIHLCCPLSGRLTISLASPPSLPSSLTCLSDRCLLDGQESRLPRLCTGDGLQHLLL
jgi:hypothetical protein